MLAVAGIQIVPEAVGRFVINKSLSVFRLAI
jgi:hypothetical protein